MRKTSKSREKESEREREECIDVGRLAQAAASSKVFFSQFPFDFCFSNVSLCNSELISQTTAMHC